MMRYTENRYGKWIIPKKHLQAATEKLARLEDAEEFEDVRAYCLQLERAAKELQKKEPEVASLLRRAADEIVNMSNFRDSAAAELAEKIEKATQRGHEMKKEIFSFLDEIDGQILDGPVAEIRKKLEELL